MSVTIKLNPITLTKSHLKRLSEHVSAALEEDFSDAAFDRFGETRKEISDQIVNDPAFMRNFTESLTSHISNHITDLIDDPWDYDFEVDLETDLYQNISCRLAEIDEEILQEREILDQANKEKQEIVDLSIKLKEAVELLKQSGYKIVEQ